MKKVNENCILLDPEEGYKEAKRLLSERFRNKCKVTTCWIKKVSDSPVLKSGDREALLDLADDLDNCKITLKATGRLTQVIINQIKSCNTVQVMSNQDGRQRFKK